MRLVILGAGALGAILVAHLARAGEEVTRLAGGGEDVSYGINAQESQSSGGRECLARAERSVQE